MYYIERSGLLPSLIPRPLEGEGPGDEATLLPVSPHVETKQQKLGGV